MLNITNINEVTNKSNMLIALKHETSDGREESLLFAITEGSGDNLDREDIANGMVDYMNFSVYTFNSNSLEENSLEEYDGGMIMFDEPYANKSTETLIKTAVEDFFDKLENDEEYTAVCLPDTFDAETIDEVIFDPDANRYEYNKLVESIRAAIG